MFCSRKPGVFSAAVSAQHNPAGPVLPVPAPGALHRRQGPGARGDKCQVSSSAEAKDGRIAVGGIIDQESCPMYAVCCLAFFTYSESQTTRGKSMP